MPILFNGLNVHRAASLFLHLPSAPLVITAKVQTLICAAHRPIAIAIAQP